MSNDMGDIWDDTLVIKAYEDSIQTAKEQVAKRIAMATNNRTGIDDHNANYGEEESGTEENASFNLQDYVRATYTDGVDYEAQIIGVNGDQFLIKYFGYDNEEFVNAKDLVPSWGIEFRRLQIEEAKRVATAEQDNDNTEIRAQKQTKSKLEGSTQRKKYKSNNYMNNSSVLIPPPPPMPPGIFDDSEDSEHLSAMLMSWYMSGYYTGLYQGQKMAQKSKK